MHVGVDHDAANLSPPRASQNRLKAIVSALQPVVLDHDVLSLGVTDFAKPLEGRTVTGRGDAAGDLSLTTSPDDGFDGMAMAAISGC